MNTKLVKIESHGKQGKWKCECGKDFIAYNSNVKLGKTKSCGCLANKSRKAIRVPTEELKVNIVKKAYEVSAKVRKLEFTLDRDEISKLINGSCFYCGSIDSNSMQRKPHKRFYYNGIDRLNNSLGYTTENCVSCCCTCNSAKGTMSKEEFLDLVDKIASNKTNRCQ